jgi:hypothetical protein
MINQIRSIAALLLLTSLSATAIQLPVKAATQAEYAPAKLCTVESNKPSLSKEIQAPVLSGLNVKTFVHQNGVFKIVTYRITNQTKQPVANIEVVLKNKGATQITKTCGFKALGNLKFAINGSPLSITNGKLTSSTVDQKSNFATPTLTKI